MRWRKRSSSKKEPEEITLVSADVAIHTLKEAMDNGTSGVIELGPEQAQEFIERFFSEILGQEGDIPEDIRVFFTPPEDTS